MYRTAAMVILCLLPALSLAAGTPELSGADDCRIVNTTGKEGVKPTWKGACRDGRAEGRGTLEWHDRKKKVVVRFQGDLKAGLMHGDGYHRLDDGTRYEGDFAEGHFHGKGTLINRHGRYDGEFAGGERNGRGKMVFVTGGRYEGQWLDGKFHGTGTAVYPSGREVTTGWVNGVRSDLAAPPSAGTKYELRTKNYGSKSYWSRVKGGSVPYEKTYPEMSEGEKQAISSAFPLIEDGDEPPYPLNGAKSIFIMISEGLRIINDVSEGALVLYADVDAQGNPISASVFTAPTDDVANLAMLAVLKHKFKPAICAGKPCAMKYPLAFVLAYPD